MYFPEVDPLAAIAPQPEHEGQSLVLRNAPTTVTTLEYLDQPPSSDQTKLSLMVWKSLIALFRRNAIQMIRVNGAPTESYFEAQYIMAAFADEVFIQMDWEGNRTWTSNLLESALFQSHVAGEVFFEKLDRLLADRDPGDKSLAAIYLNILSLGFQGKYYGQPDDGRLREYRQRLFAFVFQQPADLDNKSKKAFPDAYVETFRKEKKKLTNPKLWLGVLGLVVVSYLLISHGLWMILTSDLKDQITEVESQLKQKPH